MKEEDVAKIIDEKFKTFSEGIVSKDDFMAFQTNFNSFMDSFQKQSLKTETDAKNAELEKSKTKFSEFVEGLARDGKVLPAEKDALVTEFAGLIEAEQTMTFAEGTTKPSILMKERLGKREAIYTPPRAPFAQKDKAKGTNAKTPVEFADIGATEESIQQDVEITAYAEKNKVSYEEAAKVVMGA